MDWLLIGVIIAGALLVLWAAYKIKRAVEPIAPILAAAASLIKDPDSFKKETQEEPASLNGMDSVVLPLIQKDFPDFNVEEIRRKAERSLLSVFNALESQDVTMLSDEVSPAFYEKTRAEIADLKSRGASVKYDDVKIHRTVISRYIREGSRRVIRMQTGLEYRYCLKEGGRVVSGSEDYKTQAKYETEIAYVQDLAKIKGGAAESNEELFVLNCPNCGAPLPDPTSTYCSYCNAHLHPIYLNTWVFTDYRLA